MLNPFNNKKIDEIKYKDLSLLIKNQVSEGQYVEYKSRYPTPEKLSKGIASFANSEGGWYILGIEDDNNTNVATNIIGLELGKDNTPKRNIVEAVRNTVKNYISPHPPFEIRCVKSSKSNKLAVVVKIEKGYETPYVTKDGVIYVRKGESSDPVPENDRYLLSKLFDRNKEVSNYISEFTKSPFNLGLFNGDPFVEVYLFIKPFNLFQFNNFSEYSFIKYLKEHFNSTHEISKSRISGVVEINNLYTSSGSIIIRQVASNNLNQGVYNHIGLISELFRNGSFRFSLPLSFFEINSEGNTDLNHLPKSFLSLNGVQMIESFVKELEGKNIVGKIIDVYWDSMIIMMLVNQYLDLLEKYGFDGDISFKIRVSNSHKIIPFFNHVNFAKYYKEYGVPISFKETINYPEYSYMELPILGRGSDGVIDGFMATLVYMNIVGLDPRVLNDGLLSIGEYINSRVKNNKPNPTL